MEFPLTTQGIVFITLGWGFVISLFVSCMIKVFKSESNTEEA